MGLFNFLRRDETEPSYVRSSEEKALVRRLDIFLLSFGCISQGKLNSPITIISLHPNVVKSSSISISRISTMRMSRACRRI